MILLSVLVLLYLIQLYFVKGYFLPLLRHSTNPSSKELPISVIICAKNERDNLNRHIPLICSQDYSDFEVLIMDDHSSDDTKSVVEGLQKSFDNIRYLQASESIKNKPGKKWALSEARTYAKYDHLLLTDADSMPMSNQWIKKMTNDYNDGYRVVLGIGQYHLRNSLTNNLVQYETLFTAISYLGMAFKGFPYMGVGRNIAYDRGVISNAGIKNGDIASGDDDIGLQPYLKAPEVSISVEEESQTISEAPKSFLEWTKQKQRHYSTAPYYSRNIQFKLLLLKGSIYMPNYILIIALISGVETVNILTIFCARFLVWWGLCDRLRRHFSFRSRIYLLPCYELFFSVFDLWTTMKNLRKSRKAW